VTSGTEWPASVSVAEAIYARSGWLRALRTTYVGADGISSMEVFAVDWSIRRRSDSEATLRVRGSDRRQRLRLTGPDIDSGCIGFWEPEPEAQ